MRAIVIHIIVLITHKLYAILYTYTNPTHSQKEDISHTVNNQKRHHIKYQFLKYIRFPGTDSRFPYTPEYLI